MEDSPIAALLLKLKRKPDAGDDAGAGDEADTREARLVLVRKFIKAVKADKAEDALDALDDLTGCDPDEEMDE